MGSKDKEPTPRASPGKVQVEEGESRRPFMRGILVHSLMSRGLPFDEAYRVATLVRDRLKGRALVSRKELGALVEQVAGPDGLGEARPERRPGDILVTGRGRGAPFSKGFLSQSLLAAAIDPNQAFDVALEIEDGLVREGAQQIERAELRHRTYRAIEERVGARAAERYLVWRAYQKHDRPVILLMGGTAGAGKTSLAQEVAHRLGVAGVLSTDSIRQIMRLMLSPELAPAIHASSYDAWRQLPEDPSGSDEETAIVQGFTAMASTVCVGARAMIERAIAENASLILDGVSLVPGLVDVARYADRAHIIFLIVATFDGDAFASRFEERARTEAQRGTHRYLENLDSILRIQDHLLELAEQHGVPIVDNDSFDASVLSILGHVTESLRKQGDFDASALL